MFFEFPGILITIGVFLLLISIIIIIVAYRSDVKDVDASKLSATYQHSDSDVIHKENEKTEQVIENKTEEVENGTKDLEKTKIFMPKEIKLDEELIASKDEEIRLMGIKDMLEDINKVDNKKELDKEESIDIFNEEFDAENKEEKEVKVEEPSIEEKPEVKEQKETKIDLEEDEEIELL